jgi:hypothetical protein
MKEFNLNSNIYVRLKIEGYQRMADLHNEFLGRIKNWEKRDAQYYERQADHNGYTKFQAWSFIQDFGPVTGLAMNQIYYTTILIDENDLK